ncbi:cytochrome c oxidase subunit II [Devosia sp. PTR5]|uniref:Cytochrome aa3 subunit 2 n=1 Tax=Devosia oryzisoli TaxID=2774138 RepID=A0A927FTP6_9HYPH|nr:cytochrome c oxidase subunit II [Devosia oryzisoli]MBD8066100.1 cytochrome c oxidase subunit II [Devosia oryzisoli]
MRVLNILAGAIAVATLGGCSTSQSALVPRGEQAERINTLFWVMTSGGAVILVLVCVLAAIAIFGSASLRRRLSGEALVKGLGIALPVLVLTLLLTYGFLVLRAGAVPEGTQTNMRIAVSGELWWWRVTYTDASGTRVETANEIHLPVGRPVTLELTTADVIHSLWAPNLAGKLDMIPGRTNELTVTATEAGVTRGQCAEYCGGAHAFMSFHVVAQPPEEFEAWLAQEASPADPVEDPQLLRGQELFLNTGCGGCHAVRGTAATGSIGPDLTHVGSRRSLAAGTLPNTAEAIAAFIVNNQHIKPENKMPEYALFSDEELGDLSAYLESLR